MRLCLVLLAATSSAGRSAVTGSLDLREGGGLSSLLLQSRFTTLQNHLVIRAFISRLLVMVVENGGQNRIHLEERLSAIRAVCLKGAGRETERRGADRRLPVPFTVHENEPSPPSSTVSEEAPSPAGRVPACLHQMDHTLHFHKHAFSLSLTEDSDDNRSNQPQIQTGCGRR